MLTGRYKNLYKFYLAVLFVTIVFPKAGDKVAGIPLTFANLFFGVLLLWAVPVMLKAKLTIFEKGYLFYMLAVLVIPWLIFAGSPGTFAKIVLPLFVPMAVYYWVNPLTRTFIDRDRAYQVIKLIAIANITIILYGLAQKIFGHYQTMIPGLTMSYTDAKTPEIFYLKKNLVLIGDAGWYKVTSTYQNGNLFGAALVMLTLPVTAVFLYTKDKAEKYLFGLSTVMSFAVIPFTLARSTLFGILVGAGTLFLVQRNNRNRLIILLLTVFMFGIIFSSPFLTKRMVLSFFDPSMNGRIERMETVSNLVAQGDSSGKTNIAQKLFGLGFGSESEKVKDFFDIYTENIYFTIYALTGYMGVTVFLIVAGLLIVKMAKYIRVNPIKTAQDALAGGVFAAMVAYLLQGLIDGGIAFPPTLLIFWLLMGLGHVATEQNCFKVTGIADVHSY